LINVLIIIILVIIIILTSIMVIPFHLTLKLGNEALNLKGYFTVTWLKIRIIKRDIPSKEEKKEVEAEKKVRAEWTFDRFIRVLNLFIDSLPYFENIFYALIRSISIERFNVDFKLGLDSPVDTAEVAGFFWSIIPMINLIPKVSINMRPVFMKTTFEGNLIFELKIRLLWIVVEGLKSLTKKPVRDLINEVRA
jgi:Protein of unknown function (DUF2953)